jgi:hypothetical protein
MLKEHFSLNLKEIHSHFVISVMDTCSRLQNLSMYPSYCLDDWVAEIPVIQAASRNPSRLVHLFYHQMALENVNAAPKSLGHITVQKMTCRQSPSLNALVHLGLGVYKLCSMSGKWHCATYRDLVHVVTRDAPEITFGELNDFRRRHPKLESICLTNNLGQPPWALQVSSIMCPHDCYFWDSIYACGTDDLWFISKAMITLRIVQEVPVSAILSKLGQALPGILTFGLGLLVDQALLIDLVSPRFTSSA